MSLLDSALTVTSSGLTSAELSPVTTVPVAERVGETPWPTDADLLRRFLWRDEAAFTALLERHGNMVFAVALRVVRDRHTAEDVFQATFLILARDAARIRQEASVAAWLHGVAVRLARKALKRRSRQPVPTPHLPDPATQDAYSVLEQTFDQQVLDEELARLPDGYREPLVLHFLEGLTYEETAQSLGTTVGAIEGRLKRGKRELRLRLMRRGVGLGVILATLHASQTAAVAGQTAALTQATAAGGMSTLLGTPFASALSAEAVHLTRELAMWSVGKSLTAAAVGILLLGSFGAALVAQGGGGAEGTEPINTVAGSSEGPADATGGGTTLEPGAGGAGSEGGGFGSSAGGLAADGGSAGFGSAGGGVPFDTVPADSQAETRAQLIHCVYLDVLGRTPTAEEIDAYVADKNPAATQQLIARVLQAQATNPNAVPTGSYPATIPRSQPATQLVDPYASSGYPGVSGPGPGSLGMSKYEPGYGSSGMMGSGAPGPTKITVFKSKNPNVARIEEAMQETTEFAFDANPLSDVVAFIAEQHGINVMIDEAALIAEGIGSDSEVRIRLSGITLRSALKLLLEDVGGIELTTVVKDEVLVITTVSKADETLETRVYDVRSLQLEEPSLLVQILENGTTGGGWHNNGGEGTISYAKGAFVIRQTQKVHAEIEALLETMNEHVQQAGGDVPNWTLPNPAGGYPVYGGKAGGGMGGGYGAGQPGLGGGGQGGMPAGGTGSKKGGKGGGGSVPNPNDPTQNANGTTPPANGGGQMGGGGGGFF